MTLSRRFEMMATEVTQAQFDALMGYEPSNFAGCPECPVENLTWHEAAATCKALSEAADLPTCYACDGAGPDISCTPGAVYDCEGYRLPADAEWELAARAGTTTALYSGDISTCDSDSSADEIAWYARTAEGATHPVATKEPNAWGLFDMAGNVFEWNHDWWSSSPDGGVDPVEETPGQSRVLRGGAYGTRVEYLRSARRYGFEPDRRQLNFGVRCVRTL